MHGGTGQGANRICPTSDPSEHAGECHSRWPCDNGNTESLQFWQMRLLGLREAKLPGQGHQREDWRLGPVGLTLFCVLPSTPCSSPCHCTVTHGRHTYVHTCRHTRVYTQAHAETHRHMHTHTHATHAEGHTCAHVSHSHTRVCAHAQIGICMHTHAGAHIMHATRTHTSTQTHKHMYAHTHVHTHARTPHLSQAPLGPSLHTGCRGCPESCPPLPQHILTARRLSPSWPLLHVLFPALTGGDYLFMDLFIPTRAPRRQGPHSYI